MTHRVASKLMDKAILLPPMNFPQARSEWELISECVLFGLQLCFGNTPEESYLFCLAPDQGRSRVVDGGQFRLRVLGKEDGLLAPPQRGRGLSAQGTCRCPSWGEGVKRNLNETFCLASMLE